MNIFFLSLFTALFCFAIFSSILFGIESIKDNRRCRSEGMEDFVDVYIPIWQFFCATMFTALLIGMWVWALGDKS